jgi:homoserine O-acetyltransferase
VLPELRLHYTTLGHAHRGADGAIDNAILLLHSTGSDTREFLLPEFTEPLYGAGDPFDLGKFHVIIPEAIEHGKSSKPSDGLRGHFPHYDYEDLVAAQHNGSPRIAYTSAGPRRRSAERPPRWLDDGGGAERNLRKQR